MCHDRAVGKRRSPLDVAVGVARALPEPVAYALADAAAAPLVAWTLAHEARVASRGRGLFRNRQIAFREDESRREALRALWPWARHMTHLAVDFCRMPRITPETVERSVDTRDLRVLRDLLARRRGLLCVSGHMGVWELQAHAACVSGIPVKMLARPIESPALAQVVDAIRRAGGVEVISKWGSLWRVKKALESGALVGLLADENATERPIFAPFLGTLAATTPVPAFLQRATGAPIAITSTHRLGRGRFRFHVWRVIEPVRTADRETDLRRVTQEINDALSEAILAYPEQWLWGSRRFLTRPPGERPGPDGLPPACPRTPPSLAPATRAAREGRSAAGSR